MNRNTPIGCRSFHFYKKDGDKQICMYCSYEHKEKFVPNGETWVLSCKTFGYKIFHREAGDKEPYCLYAGHDSSEMIKLINLTEMLGSLHGKSVGAQGNIKLKEEGVKLLEQLVNERKETKTDRAGARL